MGGGEDKSFRRYSEHGISAQFKRKKAKQIAAAPPNTKKLEAVKTKPVGSGAKRSEIDDLFGRLKGRPMETALPEKAQVSSPRDVLIQASMSSIIHLILICNILLKM